MRKPVSDATGLVVNIIEIEDGADWTPPAGCTLLPPSAAAMIGGHYDTATGTFTPPPAPPTPAPDPRAVLLEQLQAAGVITAAVTAGKIPAAAVTAAGLTATVPGAGDAPETPAGVAT